MMYEYGAMVAWWLAGEIQRKSEKDGEEQKNGIALEHDAEWNVWT